MDGNWITLIVGIAIVVVVEVVAYRLYKRYRTRKEAAFTKENLGPVYDDLESVRLHLLEERACFERYAHEAHLSEDDSVACLVTGILKGKAVQLESLEKFRRRLLSGTAIPKQELSGARNEGSDLVLSDALAAYAERARAWSFGEVPAYALRARKAGFREVAKDLRRVGEVESMYADFADGLASENVDREHELSLCPTCGALYFGRRPAFCTVCSQPNFEMEQLRPGKLD